MRIPSAAASLLLACAFFPAPLAAGPGDRASDPWRLVHPQAKWILGVDWTRAKNSAAARILSRQFQEARGKLETSGFGLGAVVSLDRILASGVSLEAAETASPKGMLVAIEGILDRRKLKKELPPGTAVERFRGADLYVPPKADPAEPLLAVVSDRLLLLGDRESIGLVLSGKGGVEDPDLFGRATRLATSSEIWLVASAPQGGPSQEGARPDPLPDLRRVDLSVSMKSGLRLAATLLAASPESAQRLAGLAQLAGVIGGQDAASSWLRKLQVGLKGHELAVAFDLSAQELEQAIESARAKAWQAGQQAVALLRGEAPPNPALGLRAAARAAAAPGKAEPATTRPPDPAEPVVRTIRIIGAEGGPKEIHYTVALRAGR